jgi:hypothetical protein
VGKDGKDGGDGDGIYIYMGLSKYVRKRGMGRAQRPVHAFMHSWWCGGWVDGQGKGGKGGAYLGIQGGREELS